MGRDERIQVITSGQPQYPARLKEIKDYPKTLYYIGDVDMLSRRCVALVGSRTTTACGRNTARALAFKIAHRGVTVVSGMASGIDSCAHEGALESGGPTAAVLGCGVDVCYPAGNRILMQDLMSGGLLLSEYPPGTGPRAFRFPQRNRIISGVSEAVIVVQARNQSGALITAELASEQGREVYAIPGNIDSPFNLGTNKLIQDGVPAIVTTDDVIEILGLKKEMKQRAEKELSPLEQRIYHLFENRGEMGVDEVCIHLKDAPQRIQPVLSVMEIKGFLHSAMGKFFLANE